MAKLTLSDLANLENQSSAVATINANNTATEVAMQKALFRDGTAPNAMESDLDMDSNRILNLPEPVSNTEPARKIDLDSLEAALEVAALEAAVDDAEAAADAAADAQAAAEAALASTLTAADNFDDVYLGSKAADPTLDNDGNALVEGQIYWNNVSNALKIYDGAVWQAYSASSGDVTSNTASSVDNEIALFSSTTGKVIKRATTSGIPKLTSGVIAAAAAGTDYVAPGGALGTPSSGTLTNCTGLPVAGITASTSTALGVGTVELGHASDTTVSRVSAGVIAVEGVSLYTNIPQSSKSAAYTTVLGDANTHILHPTADNNARTFTIDSNANVAYPIGTSITFINQINTVTISITSDTLTWAGVNTTGSRTLAAGGMATAIKVTSTLWFISGVGLT